MDVSVVVTIDTEGDDEWTFHRSPTLENIVAMREFEAMIERVGAKSTYLVTEKVAADPASVGVLGEIQARGTCEIGAHCHAWNNPPIDEAREGEGQYFLNELDEATQFAKLEVLTDRIESSFGVRPTTFRAGRFGANEATMRSLQKLGYLVDSSVTPGINWQKTPGMPGGPGGPNYVGAPYTHYRMSGSDMCSEGPDGLIQIPVTVVRNKQLPAAWERALGQFGPTGLVSRIAGKAGLGNLVWFRPTFHSTDEMLVSAREALGRGARVLNMMLHSSEVLPGGSPYLRTKEEVSAFLGRTEETLEAVMNQWQAVPRTLAECGDRIRHELSRTTPASPPAGVV